MNSPKVEPLSGEDAVWINHCLAKAGQADESIAEIASGPHTVIDNSVEIACGREPYAWLLEAANGNIRMWVSKAAASVSPEAMAKLKSPGPGEKVIALYRSMAAMVEAGDA